MKRFLLFLFSLLFCSAAALAVDRNVLAHGSNERIWLAHVTPASGTITNDRTEILIRQNGPGAQWKRMAIIPDRFTELACRSDQMIGLLDNGQWMSVWSAEGAHTGQPLPANGKIMAMADDGDSLFAVGLVNGGAQAVTAANIAATQPATQPSTQPTETKIEPPAEPHLVVLKQTNGVWVPLGDVPHHDPVDPVAGVSLVVDGNNQIVAVQRGRNFIHVRRLNARGEWTDIGNAKLPEEQRILAFTLETIDNKTGLWVGTGKSAGLWYPDAVGESPEKLAWNGDAIDSLPAAAVTGGYLRVIGLRGEKIFEQRYDALGKAVGTAGELAVPGVPGKSRWQFWSNAAVLAALGVSVIATLYRRAIYGGTIINPPPPAPLWRRFAAGTIDLLPVLVVLAILVVRTDPSRDPLERLGETSAIIANAIGSVVYILHTLISELIFRRTIGKWLFGLTVVGLDNTRAKPGQIVLRNLLRVIDLIGFFPLLLIPMSPLKQRSADIAAGTMVVTQSVANGEIPVEQNEEEE